MEITGTLLHILPAQSGQGKNGPWKKQEFVIETTDSYPKKVCLAAWGDKIDLGKFTVGETVKANFDVESREYNGKWYTDLKAYNLQGANALQGSNSKTPFESRPAGPLSNDKEADDLPF